MPFFLSFIPLHVLFGSKSLLCCPCINGSRLIYALPKSPPFPPPQEMTKMVTQMLYLVLAVCFKWCRNYLYLSEELRFKGSENVWDSRWVFRVVCLQCAARGCPSICADKGHGGGMLKRQKRAASSDVLWAEKKAGLGTRDKGSHLSRQTQNRQKSLKHIGKPLQNAHSKCKHIVFVLPFIPSSFHV